MKWAGGIFGNHTVLQTIVSSILDSTSSFPNYRHQCDYLHDDGYVISEANKSRIDTCLRQFPDMLYLRSLRPADQDNPYITDDLCTYSVLNYTHRRTATHGSGWGRHGTYNVLTSVAAYLIELGAAINVDGMTLRFIDIRRMPPQLLLAMNNNHNFHGNQHIYKKQCLLDLYRNQRLTEQDLKRLHYQAKHALSYGNFTDKFKMELTSIKLVIDDITSGLVDVLNEEQFAIYEVNRNAFQTIFLQGMHQCKDTNVPQIVYLSILSYLTGEHDENKIRKIGEKLIEHHGARSPAFNQRRALK